MKSGCLVSFYTAYQDSQLAFVSVSIFVDLIKPKSQMFLKSFGRLFNITDPKYLMGLAPQKIVFVPGRNSNIRLRTKIIVVIHNIE